MMTKVNFSQLRNAYHKLFVRSAHTLKKSADATETTFLPAEDAKVYQISSGLTIAALENYCPVTRVSVVVKAGSRYENSTTLGISHVLKHCTTLSTENLSKFALTRELESIGAKISITTTRDYLIYSLGCSRDHADQALALLGEIVSHPKFLAYEVADVAAPLKLDLALHNQNPVNVLFEAVHRAAFRGGLANSLQCPEFMIGKHTSEMLTNFVGQHYVNTGSCIVGTGITLEDLQQAAGDCFQLQPTGFAGNDATKFAAGEERIERDEKFCHAAIVAEGAGATNRKEMLTFGILECILGLGSNISTLGMSTASKLGEAIAKNGAKSACYVSTLNLNYVDTGLFGVYITARPEDMQTVAKSTVAAMRGMSKNINDGVVTAAKNKLKTKIRLEKGNAGNSQLVSALEVAQHGHMKSVAQIEKEIDEIKTADVTSAASRIMKAKPALAAVGRLHSTPHLDELL